MRKGTLVSATARRWFHVAGLSFAFFASCRAPLPTEPASTNPTLTVPEKDTAGQVPPSSDERLEVGSGFQSGNNLKRSSVKQVDRFEFSEAQMGLPFRIVLYAPDKTNAETAARAAFSRIRQLNAILSDYDDDSELSRLSSTAGSGQTVKVSDELWFVLNRAQDLANRTRGAFDVTVGPVFSLWRKARRDRKLPEAARLRQALQAVGYQKLRLDAPSHTVQLLTPGMRLDLGAIAKGYAADEALKVLLGRGITRALVAGGGDMALGDPPPGKKGWRIEIAPLDKTNAPPARFVLVANAGLATSGDLFQHVEIEGKRYSHIVDPHTGVGLTDHSLVTVIARDGITADSLATAASVLGPEQGIKLIESIQGAGVHIVRCPDKEIEVSESRRFKRYYLSGRATSE